MVNYMNCPCRAYFFTSAATDTAVDAYLSRRLPSIQVAALHIDRTVQRPQMNDVLRTHICTHSAPHASLYTNLCYTTGGGNRMVSACFHTNVTAKATILAITAIFTACHKRDSVWAVFLNIHLVQTFHKEYAATEG